MRGFAISDRPLPVIVVNKKDGYKGRIFSMMHELAHVLLGDSSISGEELTPNQEEIEIFCNQVAASILLPTSWFDSDELLLSKKNVDIRNDEAVNMIAQRFNISREVVWRRLLTNQLISNSVYHKEICKLMEQYKIQKQQEKKRKKIVVPHHTKVISTIGKFYTNLVLAGYHQEKITSSSLSEYLGIKLKHLPKIENATLGGN
jgi:Zn-dependent peptidase ImmA (M78 family)